MKKKGYKEEDTRRKGRQNGRDRTRLALRVCNSEERGGGGGEEEGGKKRRKKRGREGDAAGGCGKERGRGKGGAGNSSF